MLWVEQAASMRPPEFTGGNSPGDVRYREMVLHASMRPPEFTGGNRSVLLVQGLLHIDASMRPPEFTGGNEYLVGLGQPLIEQLQ